MEAISHSSVELALLTNVNKDRAVYNTTTMPVNNSSNGPSLPPLNNTVQKNGDKDRKVSNLPKRNPVDLQFKDIEYTVDVGGLFGKQDKTILHSVNGRFPGGHLISIMGPSGAGKSTLLDVLSGFRVEGVQGSVYVNGRIRTLDQFRKMTCYITQDDRLQTLLTVMENMKLAAEFKLGDTMNYEEKTTRIEEILTLLGLYEHQTTQAGRLSGGQKKRLSIALELINNPTIMFLDEPTTGLDSHSCTQVVELLKQLARQGRTIICTIHQPSAKIFDVFDQVYVLSQGRCLYQGSPAKLIRFLDAVNLPCPMYHNPADYVIELACAEFGEDKIDIMVDKMQNGDSVEWFADGFVLERLEDLRAKNPITPKDSMSSVHVPFFRQLNILLERGWIKVKRDRTLTYLRIGVNIVLAMMLGFLFVDAGNEGSRVLDNYNLLFAILMHHSMTQMMLTVLTFPTEKAILLKEHFNRWYSLKAYYCSVTLLEIPISILCCFLFTVIIYPMSSQPPELFRFGMFFTISLLVLFVGQSLGLMIGAICGVVNGTFLAPTSTVPMMMFAGFGVTLRDLPGYLKWGSYVSYLRYGLEGYVGAIYGENRSTMECSKAIYCHYRYPKKFLSEITMRGDQFWNDVIALSTIVVLCRVLAYVLLRYKTVAVR